MPGRINNKGSPKICYDEESSPVQAAPHSCQQGLSEGKPSTGDASLGEKPAVTVSTSASECRALNPEPSSLSAISERLSLVNLTSESDPNASSAKVDKNCCSEAMIGQEQNIGALNVCQKQVLETSGAKLSKSCDHYSNQEDSSTSVAVEDKPVSVQHCSKSIDMKCPEGVVLSASQSASSADLSPSTTAALTSCQPPSGSSLPNSSDVSAADPACGASEGSASCRKIDAGSKSSGPSVVDLVDDSAPERELREACGVFGFVLSNREEPPPTFSLSRTIMDGLVALQHRGQESAGIVTSDGRGNEPFKHHRGLGLVSSVFSPATLSTLTGTLGLGHTRYSTAGGGDLSNVQPFMVHTKHGQLAIAHNGELINAATLRKTVLERGVGLSTRSDSELITQILSLTPLRGEHDGEPDWRARIRHLMEATPTSYSLALMNEDKIYAVRDPFGNRPLCVGALRELDLEGISLAGGDSSRVLGYVLSSESCAFTAVGATFVREVKPGEIIELSPDGVRCIDQVFRPQTYRPLTLMDNGTSPKQDDCQSLQPLNGSSNSLSDTNGSMPFLHDIENVPPAFCIFEYVYFARPDSVFEGQQVYSVRHLSGRQLAREAPVDVDIVSCVPDSATPAAMGFALELNIPYVEVLHKSRYVGRTFIQPCVTSRKRAVAQKFAAITNNVRGKRVVLVDDSVVRGTTIRPIVKLIRDAGALEVHFRVASPPIRHPCFMGINIPTREELVANRMPVEELAEYFCVDSIKYLSLEGLVSSVREDAKCAPGETVGHCTACLSGKYPVKKEW